MYFSDLTVRKNNDFIGALGGLSVHAFRLINFISIVLQRHDFVISELNPADDTWLITITASDYAEVNNLQTQQASTSLAMAYDELKDNKELFLKYEKLHGYYEIILHPNLSNEFSNLTGNFTSYNPIHTVKFADSVFCLRLYEVLARWKNNKKTPAIRIDTLRKLIGVDDSMSVGVFNNRVKIAIDTISKYSDLTVKVEIAKSGKKVLAYMFFMLIKPKHRCYAFKNYEKVLSAGGFSLLPNDVALGEKEIYQQLDKENGIDLASKAKPKTSYDLMYDDTNNNVVAEPSDKQPSDETSDDVKKKLKEKTSCTTKKSETTDLNNTKKPPDNKDDCANADDLNEAYSDLKPCDFSKTAKQNFLKKLGVEAVKACVLVANTYIDKQLKDGNKIVNIAGIYNKALSQNWGLQQQKQSLKTQEYHDSLTEKQIAEQEAIYQSEQRLLRQSLAQSKADIEHRKQAKIEMVSQEKQLLDFYNSLNDDEKQEFKVLATRHQANHLLSSFLSQRLESNEFAFAEPMFQLGAMNAKNQFLKDRGLL